MRIVLTRWPHQAGQLEAGLREVGVDVGFLPVTEQRLPQDLGELQAAVADLAAGRVDWLLLTSRTTVWALQQAGWDGTVPSGTRIGVTGSGTAQALPRGSEDVWMPHREASAAGILTCLPDAEPGERVVLPQSAQARPQLVEGLRASGRDVTQVTAYETVSRVTDGSLPPSQDPGALGPGDLTDADVMLVTSSSAARAWSQLKLADGVRPRLLAIGRPTAVTLAELGLPARTLDGVSAGAVMRALRRG